MKKVYICSPYRGDTETNVENARKYCRAAVELSCLPIAPQRNRPDAHRKGKELKRCAREWRR